MGSGFCKSSVDGNLKYGKFTENNLNNYSSGNGTSHHLISIGNTNNQPGLENKSDTEASPLEKTTQEDFQYDIVVIGGGSGGLACAKEAATFSARVACLDFVDPSPRGSVWGLGGTCVNVGCIPKKLMHTAALLKDKVKDSEKFGWLFENGSITGHDWKILRQSVQNYVSSLNWGYKKALKDKGVKYINAKATFIDKHTIEATKKNGNKEKITSKKFVLATGGRPTYPDFPGNEFCITSDDLFSLKKCPGKTLVIGGSYVALECAGFLAGLGLDVTIYIRSILLRGFDQQMAELIGAYMKNHGVKFRRPCIPKKVEQLKDGNLKVFAFSEDEEIIETFETVFVAVGRAPCTSNIGLEKANVRLQPKTGHVLVDNREQTNVESIYAIGDICYNKPELTPVAIQAGKMLARRLFANSKEVVDYDNVPTTVFAPLEYGCIGLAEEDAIVKFGEDDIEVYHQYFEPLEWTVAERDKKYCYAKLICQKSKNQKVVGLHITGPNAGEVTQGWTIGMRMGATKTDFEETLGIHPTCSEVFTTLYITKRSEKNPAVTGC
ncbi:DgyrCDS4167 [Dimorphilus gyrociliatus]|uniref:thioredoxin-disulfide reductase (NADPH) n=1 Tax=Dimorphilus gyrociliatus TaxID=2664684 RepID=A0A7I8VG61_9ANNE|nr:DgyrCDS4167 [Dimorphilus gyrociliatus]